jgi:hypothetical protein
MKTGPLLPMGTAIVQGRSSGQGIGHFSPSDSMSTQLMTLASSLHLHNSLSAKSVYLPNHWAAKTGC